MTFRTLYLILFAYLILPAGRLNALPLSAGEDGFTPFLAESAGDNVNVRAGQSVNYERLCQLQKGEEVVVVGKEFSWYRIQLPPSARCYVNKDYVQFLGQNAGGVTADSVNIRAGAGIHHTALGQLDKGQQVYILEELDKWYRIEPVEESYGWISEEYLTFKSEDVSDYRFAFLPKPYIGEDLPVVTLLDEGPPDEEPVERLPDEELMAEELPDEEPVRKMRETVKRQTAQAREEDPGTIAVSGYVEAYEKRGTDGIYYKIVENDRPICYVQGVNNMLGRFVNLKVKVEGTVNQKLWSRYEIPVITVYKIRLML